FMLLLYLFFGYLVKLSLLFLSMFALVFFYFYFPPLFPPIDCASLFIVILQVIVMNALDQTNENIELMLLYNRYGDILLLYFKDANKQYDLHHFQAGAFCSVSGELLVPDGATNPHEFDYQNYLWHQGIRYQMILPSLDTLECKEHSWLGYIYNFRTFLLQSAADKLEEETYQWFSALILGDDNALENETIDLFQR